MLLVSSRAGKLEGAGRDTAADAVLRLAGAHNVLAGERGYKALSAEGAVSLKPEVIVTTTHVGERRPAASTPSWRSPASRSRPRRSRAVSW